MKTIVETNTGKLLFSTDNDNYICLENQSKIDIHLTEMFVSPFFDFQSNSYYEGATSEEIASMIVVPDSISQMKLRKQVILSGISIASIDALIQSLPQPNRDLIYTMWEYALVFDRHNPELKAMAQMLNITQQQLDEIFINGNLL